MHTRYTIGTFPPTETCGAGVVITLSKATEGFDRGATEKHYVLSIEEAKEFAGAILDSALLASRREV